MSLAGLNRELTELLGVDVDVVPALEPAMRGEVLAGDRAVSRQNDQRLNDILTAAAAVAGHSRSPRTRVHAFVTLDTQSKLDFHGSLAAVNSSFRIGWAGAC